MKSELRMMWCLVAFDLPSVTTDEQRQYRQFKSTLESIGFERLQFSIYTRFCPSRSKEKSVRQSVIEAVPPEGTVRIMSFTDKQFKQTDRIVGGTRKESSDPPDQIDLL